MAPRKDGWELIQAALDGKIHDVAELLSRGFDVHSRSPDGGTALHNAAKSGYREIARLLLDHGANVNETDVDRWTPLHFAASRDHIEIVRFLVQRGADVNAKTVQGSTPLHFAATWAGPDMARLLLSLGAEPDIRNAHALLASDKAALRNQSEVLKVIEDFCADRKRQRREVLERRLDSVPKARRPPRP